MTITTFQPGTDYRMSWVTDAQAETIWRVIKRTAKTVTLHAEGWGTKTCRVRANVAWQAEEVAPLGRYSMAPVLVAARAV
jgi:hypothetical protein